MLINKQANTRTYITQQEKIQRTEEKRCTVNHVAEFVKRNSDSQRTEVQRYAEVKTLRCTERCTERSDLRSPFLLRSRSSVTTPLLELRYYSALGAPLLLLSWRSVTTPLLELRYYSALGAPLLHCSWSSVTTPLLELRYYSFFGAPLPLQF